MGNGRKEQYEFREPPGQSWFECRMWVISEINRNAKEIREVDESHQDTQVSVAVLESRSALLGFVGGIIASGAVSLIIKLLVH